MELTSKLDRMETEMCLVSEESKNLQQAVEIKDSVILDQVAIFLQNIALGAPSLYRNHTITITQNTPYWYVELVRLLSTFLFPL